MLSVPIKNYKYNKIKDTICIKEWVYNYNYVVKKCIELKSTVSDKTISTNDGKIL